MEDLGLKLQEHVIQQIGMFLKIQNMPVRKGGYRRSGKQGNGLKLFRVATQCRALV